MTRTEPAARWGAYLATLRKLPFVREVRVRGHEPLPQEPRGDGELEVDTDWKTFRMVVDERRIPRINRAALDALIHKQTPSEGRLRILFTTYATRNMAKLLVENQVNFVDTAGNCHLELGQRFIARIEGLPPQPRLPGQRSIGEPGYRTIFALLADLRLLTAPIRHLAEVAEVAKTTAAETLERLEHDGLIAQHGKTRVIARPEELMDRWVYGYLDVLRPRFMLGQFRTQLDPQELEREVEQQAASATPHPTYAWGGGAAAHRINGHYRGETTVLHLADREFDWLRPLRMNPTKSGTFVIIQAPRAAFKLQAPVVHPLLVYAELLARQEERARAAAREIRETQLAYLR